MQQIRHKHTAKSGTQIWPQTRQIYLTNRRWEEPQRALKFPWLLEDLIYIESFTRVKGKPGQKKIHDYEKLVWATQRLKGSRLIGKIRAALAASIFTIQWSKKIKFSKGRVGFTGANCIENQAGYPNEIHKSLG